MILGYIVSKDKIKIENFKCIDSLPSDNDIPKIIIGREFSKELNVKTSVLVKKIDKNITASNSSRELMVLKEPID